MVLQKLVDAMKTEMDMREERQSQRVHLLENEVLKLQKKLTEKEEFKKEKGRDLFVTKKGFTALPQYTGKVEDSDDWRFQVSTFLGMEDHFKDLVVWTEKQMKEPEKDDLEKWELEEDGRNANLMTSSCTTSCVST